MVKQQEKEKKKVKRPTPLKRDIQNEKRRLNNKTYKSRAKTAIRALHDAFETKENQNVTENLQAVYSILDKCVKKGVFKLNKASRTKSRLAAKVAAKQSA